VIRSMTGFGEASGQVEGVHYAVELRSLNNRYFKALLRLPEEISGLEAELEADLRRELTRGSVTVTVKMRLPDAQAAHRVNDEALLRYLDHLETIHARVAKEGHAANIDLTALLAMPGVLQPSEDEAAMLARSRPAVLDLAQQACDRLVQMRVTEGRSLAADLQKHCEVIRGSLAKITGRAPTVVEEYHVRLRSRMDELMARAELNVAEQDLIREVAVFAERADISEETSRIEGHLNHVGQILKASDKDPAGRTLDFLAQEMLREANTVASKSNDEDISRAIVIVKGAIDRIKEQVQNIE